MTAEVEKDSSHVNGSANGNERKSIKSVERRPTEDDSEFGVHTEQSKKANPIFFAESKKVKRLRKRAKHKTILPKLDDRVQQDSQINNHTANGGEALENAIPDQLKDINVQQLPSKVRPPISTEGSGADVNDIHQSADEAMDEDMMNADNDETASSNCSDSEEDRDMTTEEKQMMYETVREGDVDQLEVIMDSPITDINTCWYGENMLMAAIRGRQEEMALYLIDNGINYSFETIVFDPVRGESDKLKRLNWYTVSCRQMAYDAGMADVVELIDKLSGALFPFIKLRDREIRLWKPYEEREQERRLEQGSDISSCCHCGEGHGDDGDLADEEDNVEHSCRHHNKHCSESEGDIELTEAVDLLKNIDIDKNAPRYDPDVQSFTKDDLKLDLSKLDVKPSEEGSLISDALTTSVNEKVELDTEECSDSKIRSNSEASQNTDEKSDASTKKSRRPILKYYENTTSLARRRLYSGDSIVRQPHVLQGIQPNAYDYPPPVSPNRVRTIGSYHDEKRFWYAQKTDYENSSKVNMLRSLNQRNGFDKKGRNANCAKRQMSCASFDPNSSEKRTLLQRRYSSPASTVVLLNSIPPPVRIRQRPKSSTPALSRYKRSLLNSRLPGLQTTELRWARAAYDRAANIAPLY
ncbi:uncharacterized protein LOC141905963 [Tubulanus polymorphus]|uniref:uncharacterized protein LOC141905963 n=1 Tax=Tubulanus polymorphus TaxID=672921 RepID=UPI003DA36653